MPLYSRFYLLGNVLFADLIGDTVHRAGFIDPGFRGVLVFEVTSQEETDLEIHDHMPIGELNVFRTTEPDKVYGAEIGSNYVCQTGPRPAKYFRGMDYRRAAKNIGKLSRTVLVQDASLLKATRRNEIGFEFIADHDAAGLTELIEKKGIFQSRYDCEDDSLVLQVIPYALAFGPDGTVFSYVRSSDIRDYGDERLFGKHSIGLGGHISMEDGPDFVRGGLEREVCEEEVRVVGRASDRKLIGTLYQPDNPVDKVHFGLVYAFRADSVVPKESSIVSGKMVPIRELLSNSKSGDLYETWSRVLIPYLNVISGMVSK